MDEICEQCGKTITQRAKANLWKGEQVVCTACLNELKSQVQRHQAAVRLAGRAGSAWLVHDGQQQWGPFPTDQIIELLRVGQIDWMWNVWREGMAAWTPAAQFFTAPELSKGRIELRDFGQGDGTYRPPKQLL
jgi:hypothetical protein